MARFAALPLLLLAAGCFDHAHDDPVRLGPIGRLFGGADNVDVVKAPDRVQAFRIRRPTAGNDHGSYNQWTVVAGPVRVPDDLAARFSRGLTVEKTYRGDNPKACDPSPGYMLRFTKAGRSIDVTFCFECAILFTHRGAVSIWYANIDDSTQAIAALLLQVFPQDADLKRIAG